MKCAYFIPARQAAHKPHAHPCPHEAKFGRFCFYHQPYLRIERLKPALARLDAERAKIQAQMDLATQDLEIEVHSPS